jgi:hypothetical protein
LQRGKGEHVKKAKDMTGVEVVEALGDSDVRAKVRLLFSNWCGRIESAGNQQKGLPPVELRRMELEAAEEIIALIKLYED